MNNSKLFNSKTNPIPQIRPDIEVIPINKNGNSYLYFHDIRGYVTSSFALDQSVETILSLLDGRKSINDLKPYLGNGTTTDQLLQYIQFLDKNRLLYSAHFKEFAEKREAEYEQSPVHQSVTAGGSYPAEPKELNEFLDEAFAKHARDEQSLPKKPVKAIYVPHIDPRVGMKTYVESFRLLRSLKPERVVILATSHYAGLHANLYRNKPFVVSAKDFEMPQGTIPADRRAIHSLMKDADRTGLTDRDRAHRIEHSIELPLLFLSYMWQHSYSIVPIVLSGFDELFYMKGSHLSVQIEHFSKQLRNQFANDKKTLFLISGDLAHVGRKFGDSKPAKAMQREVESFDQQFLTAGKENSPDTMLQLMKHNYDPYRICGFPPLYTFLKTFPDVKGQQISYGRWDETERESAVTFGSLLYQ